MKILLFVLFIGLLSGCATTEEYKPMPIAPPQSTTVPVEHKGVYHKVLLGQTIWQIAEGYGVNIKDIIDSNKIPNGGAL